MENAGVSVFLVGESTSLFTVSTDAAGAYSFTVDNGTYYLTVTPPGASVYNDALVNDITIEDADVTQDVVLVQNTGITISGVVTNLDAATVGGIYVQFREQTSINVIASALTDGSGAYSIPLPANTYTVDLVRHGGPTALLPSSTSIQVLQNVVVNATDTLDITAPFATLSGQTIDELGNPVAGVKVTVEKDWLVNYITYFQNYTTSDASGNYSLVVIKNLNCLTLEAPESSAYANTVNDGMNIAATTSMDLVIKDKQVLSGFVLDDDGNKVGGVVLTFMDQATGLYVECTTSASSGAYSIILSPDEFFVLAAVENLSITTDTTLDISAPFITVSGLTVDNDSNAVGDVTINVDQRWPTNTRNFELITTATSDAQGSYSIVLMKGLEAVALAPPTDSNYANTAVTGMTLTASKTLNLQSTLNTSSAVLLSMTMVIKCRTFY